MPRIQKTVKRTVAQAKKAGTYEKGLGQATRTKLQSTRKNATGRQRVLSKLSTSAPLPRGQQGRKLAKGAPAPTATPKRTKRKAY